jgi:hypothetical protein
MVFAQHLHHFAALAIGKVNVFATLYRFSAFRFPAGKRPHFDERSGTICRTGGLALRIEE